MQGNRYLILIVNIVSLQTTASSEKGDYSLGFIGQHIEILT